MIVIDITCEHGAYNQSNEIRIDKPKKHSDLKKKHPYKTFTEGTVMRGVKATSVNIRAKPLLQQLANMSTVMNESPNSRQCGCSENPPSWFFVYMNKVTYGRMKTIVIYM